jgi:hypothetical protein
MLKVIKVAPSAPMVSHLLFADDSMLFFKADRENAQEALSVLNTYCQASGQQVIWINPPFILLKGVVRPRGRRL